MLPRPLLIPLALLAMLCGTDAWADPASASERARQAFASRSAVLGQLSTAIAAKASPELVHASSFEGPERSASQCDADSDGDGLSDCVETNTGRFIDSRDTGTDPLRADSDGDGLGDGEEVLGSETGLDLRALGVHPLRRDLLVEYDWFDSDYDCGPHSQRPTAEVIARVVDMFAAAPQLNPDGSRGINLIQDYGQGPFTGGNQVLGHDAILPGGLDADFHAVKDDNFDAARFGYFRYVLMPHRYGGGLASSGYAEVVGDDAIVSLYCLNTTDNVARAIAHEIGHLLGLHHGGFEACNNKPNYNSLMNYRFQFAGLDTQCDAQGDALLDDFSDGSRLTLDEAALIEAQGVCGNPPIDWNGDGALDRGIAMDLNPEDGDSCGTELRELQDFDDWAHLSFEGLLDFRGKLDAVQQETACAGAPLPQQAAGQHRGGR